MLRRCAGAIGRARRNVSCCVMSIRFELRCCRARRGFVVKFTKRWHFHRETRRCAGAIDPTRLHVLFLVMSSPILGADRVARDDAGSSRGRPHQRSFFNSFRVRDARPPPSAHLGDLPDRPRASPNRAPTCHVRAGAHFAIVVSGSTRDLNFKIFLRSFCYGFMN